MRRIMVGEAFELKVSIEDHSSEPEKKAKKSSPRKVVVGQEFNAKVSLTGSAAEAKDAVTRSQIVWTVFAMCAAFLLGAAAWGMYKDEFSGLQTVWGVVGPIYGGIAGYFFPHKKK